MSQQRKVAVVGGGVAGLVAAVELARGGAGVVLFERAAACGGRAASREADGFVFNQGPHALYLGGALRKTLSGYGVELTGGPPPTRSGVALWGEARHPLPVSFATIVAAAPLSWRERARLLGLFAKLPRLDLSAWRGRPLSAFTAELSPRLRALVHALIRLSTYAHAPDALDAAAALAQLRLAAGGVIYLDGGWRVIVEALLRIAREAGAEIRLSAPVETIAAEGGRWRIGDFVADAVVLAAPPEICARLLPGSAAIADAARVATPVRAISLDYGLRRLPQPESTFALGIEAPFYFSVHSATAKLAPEAGALVHASRYLAPDEAADAAAIESVRALVARLQPGFEAEIAHSGRLVGMPVAFDMPEAARGGRMAPVGIDDAPGVFLAGDWVGYGAMLSDAAAKSAREAAAAALKP